MIELRIQINRHLELLNIKAVRVEPLNPKDGDLCKYQIYINKKYAGMLIHPFGNGVSLGKKMFEHYEIWNMKENE